MTRPNLNMSVMNTTPDVKPYIIRNFKHCLALEVNQDVLRIIFLSQSFKRRTTGEFYEENKNSVDLKSLLFGRRIHE
jgi:hypothetical protein